MIEENLLKFGMAPALSTILEGSFLHQIRGFPKPEISRLTGKPLLFILMSNDMACSEKFMMLG
ncbi:hypothetical protein [Paenibacillus hexagrammi]|uniref:Uncharacterized protein n=1 Tax=Paenibacillus hexagrammi TaxID=2908839 RepID=A0ABY3SIB1_9BACL|nr:hypothetical protein [Paenibacillus sp. YPD9-1]UJF32697.1 hypothetical protein L0M14_24230 [Paenibacillus sp. YPD9-1]